MDRYTVYVLYSKSFQKTYTGFSSNFEARLKSHNDFGKKDWAVRYRPWEILITEEYDTKSEAMNREKFFKSGQGRESIKRIVDMKYKK